MDKFKIFAQLVGFFGVLASLGMLFIPVFEDKVLNTLELCIALGNLVSSAVLVIVSDR